MPKQLRPVPRPDHSADKYPDEVPDTRAYDTIANVRGYFMANNEPVLEVVPDGPLLPRKSLCCLSKPPINGPNDCGQVSTTLLGARRVHSYFHVGT